MLRKTMFWVTVLLVFGGLLHGCVTTEAYKTAMERGSGFEAREQYINAYDAYKTALAEKKDDDVARGKIASLGQKIAADFTREGQDAMSVGRLKDAGAAFDNALKYKTGYGPAVQGKQDLLRAQNRIENEYAGVQAAKEKNQWIEAVALLQGLQAVYKDDPGLARNITDTMQKGYEFYRSQGLSALQNGHYKDALSFFQQAGKLQPGTQNQKDIDGVQTLIRAEKYYQQALGFKARNGLVPAFNALIEARKITGNHHKVNALYQELLPAWSSQVMAQGMAMLENNDHAGAYRMFNRLYESNPDFPQAAYYYQTTREVLLKLKYENMVDLVARQNWPGILEMGNDFYEMAPEGFLYSKEMYANLPLSAFNLFYQRGLHYMKTGHYGKAVLAFRSAEDQLGETALTRSGIKRAMEKIAEANRLNMAFWNFDSDTNEAGVSEYASQKLKQVLRDRVSASPLKNIVLKYDIISDDEMNAGSDSGNIDWGLIQSKSCNALITGKIESLRIDNARQSQWKTRVYKKRKIIDNKRYLSQVMKLAKLKNALMNKLPQITVDLQRIPKKDYKKEIKKIEDSLPGISPKIEADVEEKQSYQVEKYTMTAGIRMTVSILYQNGSLVWPATSYEDDFAIEDLVIAPDLQSQIPEERAGDPLVLPSRYEFTQMALDHIIETKIIPDLKNKLDDYGMRFYTSAKKLYALDSSGDVSNAGFRDAVEAYYSFLICYKDKGESDDKPETVQRLLDRFVSQVRLLNSTGL